MSKIPQTLESRLISFSLDKRSPIHLNRLIINNLNRALSKSLSREFSKIEIEIPLHPREAEVLKMISI